MSNKAKENGKASASPVPYMNFTNDGGELQCYDTGLTKREDYAKAAMTALICSPHGSANADVVAKNAFQYADALLSYGESNE